MTSNPTIECVDTGGRSGGQRPEVAVEVAVEAVTGLYVAMWEFGIGGQNIMVPRQKADIREANVR